MPKGITQDQVNTAADALVTAGDNPTVEKVRAALGTGSPNTVTRMLEAWRTQLGARLRQLQALPQLPADVGQAMTTLWMLALDHATRTAAAQLAGERAALTEAQAALTAERTRWTSALDEAAAAIAQARARQELAEHACHTLDGQLQDSHALRTDLVQQRDRLQVQLDRLVNELAHRHDELQQRDAALADERLRHDTHLHAIEDRAHGEVDRARQESKTTQRQLDATLREHAHAQAAWEQQRDALQRHLQELERRLAHETGRAAALEASAARNATKARKTAAIAKKPSQPATPTTALRRRRGPREGRPLK